MAATITIRRWTNPIASPVKTDITSANTRASTSDAPTPGSSDPIPIPTDATPKFSFWVSTRLQATTTPAGTIDNLRWFTDGGNPWTGVDLILGVGFQSGYVTALGTQGDTGTELTTPTHSGLVGVPDADAFTFTSGAPKSLAGQIDNPNTGDFGQLAILQMRVNSAAGPGTLAQETMSFRFDET